MVGTPTYYTWGAMLQRCHNPKSSKYQDYGARGITVCEKWHDFLAFYADMGARPQGMTIERIDQNKGYYPGNCRWADNYEQASNKRNNIVVTFNGQTRILREWARHLNIGYAALRHRYKAGKRGEDLLHV